MELDVATIKEAVDWLRAWLVANVLTRDAAVQLVAIAVAWVAAMALAGPVRSVVRQLLARLRRESRLRRAEPLLRSLVIPVVWILAVWVCESAARSFGHAVHLLRLASSLLGVWIVVRISSSVIADPFWSRTAAIAAWTIAALNAVQLLEPTVAFLDGIAIQVGAARLSVFSVLKGAGLAALLLWLAVSASTLLQRRIEKLPNLTPSIRVLISQTSKVALVSLAILVALGSIGIDLTAFHVFSGAVGVGVGFGLQKVISNLISGIILLLDRSIKPGDTIEVAGTYGWVNSLGARYASVLTRDGTEHLIPNEDLITQPVVNWSYSDNLVRRRVPIGISYRADLDLATRLILEAAAETDRILTMPEPQCLLKGFGDSSVDLELRFWISDPQAGVSNVADRVLRKVWHKFHEQGVEIPFPQRDLHLRSAEVVRVVTSGPRDVAPAAVESSGKSAAAPVDRHEPKGETD